MDMVGLGPLAAWRGKKPVCIFSCSARVELSPATKTQGQIMSRSVVIRSDNNFCLKTRLTTGLEKRIYVASCETRREGEGGRMGGRGERKGRGKGKQRGGEGRGGGGEGRGREGRGKVKGEDLSTHIRGRLSP